MDIALALAPTLCVGAVSGTLCVLCQSRNKPRVKWVKFIYQDAERPTEVPTQSVGTRMITVFKKAVELQTSLSRLVMRHEKWTFSGVQCSGIRPVST